METEAKRKETGEKSEEMKEKPRESAENSDKSGEKPEEIKENPEESTENPDKSGQKPEKSAGVQEKRLSEAGNRQEEPEAELAGAEIVDAGVKEPQAAVRITDAEPDYSDIEVRNPRIGKVLKLQEEARRQNEIEKLRSKRIRQEQEYIDKMSLAVEEHLRETKEEQRYNEQFEERIRYEVYRMHGISEDKLQGMTEYRRAWYQGAAFALFFLSLVLIVLCGVLHGFGSEICIFMAFYTAIEGALLSNGRKQAFVFEVITKILYLALFPTMMVAFVCYELGFEEYAILVPIFTVAGVVVLIIGAISYFLYDPYRMDRKNRKKANSYIKEIERAALKEVRLKEKAFAKQEKKKEKRSGKEAERQKKEEEAAEKRRQKSEERAARREKRAVWWSEKKAALPFGKKQEAEEEQENEHM